MSPRKLNIEQLRKRARELCRLVQSRDQKALNRIARVLPRFRGPSVQDFRYGHALAVLARESGHASWEKLLLAEAASREAKRRKQERATRIASIAAELVNKAKKGDVAALAKMPLGKADWVSILDLLKEDTETFRLLADVCVAGLSHKSPPVRFGCAHLLDRFGAPEAVPQLIRLSYDPVPRVRWMAMHALSCDICKRHRPQSDEAVRRAAELALTDLSVQVRRHATCAVGQLGGSDAEAVLRTLENDPDVAVRRNARQMLRLMNRRSQRRGGQVDA